MDIRDQLHSSSFFLEILSLCGKREIHCAIRLDNLWNFTIVFGVAKSMVTYEDDFPTIIVIDLNLPAFLHFNVYKHNI
jgi:hypothetical protein